MWEKHTREADPYSSLRQNKTRHLLCHAWFSSNLLNSSTTGGRIVVLLSVHSGTATLWLCSASSSHLSCTWLNASSLLLSIITPPSAHVAFVCVSVHLSRSLPHSSFFPLCKSTKRARTFAVPAVPASFSAANTYDNSVRGCMCAQQREGKPRCWEEAVRDSKNSW